MLPDSRPILGLGVVASTPTLAVGMAVWPNPKLGVDASRPNLELGVEASMPTSAQLGVGRGRVQPNLGVGVDACPNPKLGVHHVAVGLP
jgi:hypothetical protein